MEKKYVFVAYEGSEDYGNEGETILVVTDVDYWRESGHCDDQHTTDDIGDILEEYGFFEDSECCFSSEDCTVEQITEILKNHPRFVYNEAFAEFIKSTL